MARTYSIETRLRVALEEHARAGTPGRTIVMGPATWVQLASEAGGYVGGFFWQSEEPGQGSFRGVNILVKEYVPTGDFVIGT